MAARADVICLMRIGRFRGDELTRSAGLESTGATRITCTAVVQAQEAVQTNVSIQVKAASAAASVWVAADEVSALLVDSSISGALAARMQQR
jgi:hypothetical protein